MKYTAPDFFKKLNKYPQYAHIILIRYTALPENVKYKDQVKSYA